MPTQSTVVKKESDDFLVMSSIILDNGGSIYASAVIAIIWKHYGTQFFLAGYSREEFEEKLLNHDDEVYSILTRLLNND